MTSFGAKARTRQAFPEPIEDVFSIKGRGTVATGRVETGIVKVNEKLKSSVFGTLAKLS